MKEGGLSTNGSQQNTQTFVLVVEVKMLPTITSICLRKTLILLSKIDCNTFPHKASYISMIESSKLLVFMEQSIIPTVGEPQKGHFPLI